MGTGVVGSFSDAARKVTGRAGGMTSKVTNRASREAVQRIPMLRTRDEARRQRRRDEHAHALPTLETSAAEHVRRLEHDGVSITTLDALGLAGTDHLQDVLGTIREALESRRVDGASTIRATNDEVAEDPVIWRWGLDERLLDIVETHLGLPPRYYGAEVRSELADSRTFDVRQWHRDVEDDRLFKVLIWLNDVDIETGPFEYVERPATDRTTHALSYVSGFVSDDRLASALDRSEWRAAVGPQWTAVMADTANVFHRAKPPSRHDRYSVTYTFSSWHPRKLYPKTPFTPAQQGRIRAGLSARQLACLPDSIGN